MSETNGKAPDAAYNLRRKEDMYRLWQSGRFGNKLRSWNSWEEINASDFRGEFSMRTKMGGNGATAYRVPYAAILSVQEKWMKEQNVPLVAITFNESAPDEFLTMQGEVMRDERGLALFYSFEKTKMKEALKRSGEQTQGLQAQLLLQGFMDPSSYDDLQSLLEDFPKCVIEFGCYSIDLGNCPRRNTIFWEVRDY